VFSFPNPVNEKAARVVALGVVLMSVCAIAFQEQWLLIPLAYGFWARVLAGPRLSPLGQLATRVVAPRLGEPRFVAGPPKRFAQAMGVFFSSAALISWFGFSWDVATWVLVGMLAGAAFLEGAFGYCVGCKIFGALMKKGLIPDDVCESCADVSIRHPELRRV
jgi:Domain of unknown function (DUF4395)